MPHCCHYESQTNFRRYSNNVKEKNKINTIVIMTIQLVGTYWEYIKLVKA